MQRRLPTSTAAVHVSTPVLEQVLDDARISAERRHVQRTQTRLHAQHALPTVIWEERVAAAHADNPTGYNGMPQFTPKTATSPSTITTPSNTPIPRSTPLTIPNGIRIQSAILPQYTSWSDRQTDRWDRRITCSKSAYAHSLWIVSDALIIHTRTRCTYLTTCQRLLHTSAAVVAVACVGRSVASVSVSVRVLKGKRLELSTPKSVDI